MKSMALNVSVQNVTVLYTLDYCNAPGQSTCPAKSSIPHFHLHKSASLILDILSVMDTLD